MHRDCQSSCESSTILSASIPNEGVEVRYITVYKYIYYLFKDCQSMRCMAVFPRLQWAQGQFEVLRKCETRDPKKDVLSEKDLLAAFWVPDVKMLRVLTLLWNIPSIHRVGFSHWNRTVKRYIWYLNSTLLSLDSRLPRQRILQMRRIHGFLIRYQTVVGFVITKWNHEIILPALIFPEVRGSKHSIDKHQWERCLSLFALQHESSIHYCM